MTHEPIRIAFWTGPRNVSTALLRAWGSRPDTVVVDEPFYAHYLHETGFDHPARDGILASQPVAAQGVIDGLFAPLPAGRTIHYQKQMTHHLLPSVPRDWLDRVRHGLLIRDPAEVIASYTKIIDVPTPEGLGYPQATEIYERVVESTGSPPPVVDARDLLSDPPGMLAKLCDALGVPYDERMLTWEPGPRDTDGVWAPHWYANVEKTTGFQPYTPREVSVPDEFAGVHAACDEHYRRLHEVRIQP